MNETNNFPLTSSNLEPLLRPPHPGPVGRSLLDHFRVNGGTKTSSAILELRLSFAHDVQLILLFLLH